MKPAHFHVKFWNQTKWIERKLTTELKSSAIIKEANQWFPNIKLNWFFFLKLSNYLQPNTFQRTTHLQGKHACRYRLKLSLIAQRAADRIRDLYCNRPCVSFAQLKRVSDYAKFLLYFRANGKLNSWTDRWLLVVCPAGFKWTSSSHSWEVV